VANFDGNGAKGVYLAIKNCFHGFEVFLIIKLFPPLTFFIYFENLTPLEPLIPLHINHHFFYFFEVNAGSVELVDNVLISSHAASGRG
jgi:hypothetical protein